MGDKSKEKKRKIPYLSDDFCWYGFYKSPYLFWIEDYQSPKCRLSVLMIMMRMLSDSTLSHRHSFGLTAEGHSIWLKSFSCSLNHSVPSSSVGGGGVILKNSPPIRIEMFHRIMWKMSQNNVVLICCDALLLRDKLSVPSKCPRYITEPRVLPLLPSSVRLFMSGRHAFYLGYLYSSQ